MSSVAGSQPRRELLEACLPARDDNEVMAVSGEALGERLTDSSRGPGH